jgi:hypothetical protein
MAFSNQWYKASDPITNFNLLRGAAKIRSWPSELDMINGTNENPVAMSSFSFVNWDYHQLDAFVLPEFANWIPYDKDTIIDIIPLPVVYTLNDFKLQKLETLNQAYNRANTSTFTYNGLVYNADSVAQNNINSTANYINKFGAFPTGFLNAWLSDDGTILPLPTVDDFWLLYQAYTAQGIYNITHFTELKAQVLSVTTQAELDAIVW